jgi:hypothetical protein
MTKHNLRPIKLTSSNLVEELPEYFAQYLSALPQKIQEEGNEKVYKKLKSVIDT